MNKSGKVTVGIFKFSRITVKFYYQNDQSLKIIFNIRKAESEINVFGRWPHISFSEMTNTLLRS